MYLPHYSEKNILVHPWNPAPPPPWRLNCGPLSSGATTARGSLNLVPWAAELTRGTYVQPWRESCRDWFWTRLLATWTFIWFWFVIDTTQLCSVCIAFFTKQLWRREELSQNLTIWNFLTFSKKPALSMEWGIYTMHKPGFPLSWKILEKIAVMEMYTL